MCHTYPCLLQFWNRNKNHKWQGVFNLSFNSICCLCVVLVSLTPNTQKAIAAHHGCQAVTVETFCIIDGVRSSPRPKQRPNRPSRAQQEEERRQNKNINK